MITITCIVAVFCHPVKTLIVRQICVLFCNFNFVQLISFVYACVHSISVWSLVMGAVFTIQLGNR